MDGLRPICLRHYPGLKATPSNRRGKVPWPWGCALFAMKGDEAMKCAIVGANDYSPLRNGHNSTAAAPERPNNRN